MSGINECTDLVELRFNELSGQINDTYHNLDDRMIELDTKEQNNRSDHFLNLDKRIVEMGTIDCGSGKEKNILLLNMVICILVLILLIKSFVS